MNMATTNPQYATQYATNADFQQGQPYSQAAPYPPQPAAYPPQPTPYPQNQYGGENANAPYATGYQDAPSGPPPPYPGNYTGGQPAAYQETYPKPENAEDDTPPVAFANGPFTDKAIRRAFIRKVYLILMAQLLVTVAFICVFLFVHPVRLFVKRNPAVYYVSYATFAVTYFALVCCPTVRRKYPTNFIALLIFTLALSYMVGTISSFYDATSVLIAAGITCGICLAISLFATFTKIDFTLCTGLLFVLSVGLFLFGISCIIVWRVQGPNYVLQCVYGGLAAVVFGLFLAYDTQVVLGGKRHELSEEEYIFGALQLYIDVVYLFLIVLSFFGNKN